MEKLKRDHVFRLLDSIEIPSQVSGRHAAVLKSMELVMLMPLRLGQQDRIKVILRLKAFLLHQNPTLVQNIVTVLLALIEKPLPSDVALALMRQSRLFLEYCRDEISRSGNILELLQSIFFFWTSDMSEVQNMLRKSQCLDLMLSILHNKDFEDSDLLHIEGVVNILIYATSSPTNYENSLAVMNAVTPLVTNYLLEWVCNLNTSTIFERVLKELLFLVRSVIANHTHCQDIFLQYEGVDTLISSLGASDKMSHHMEIIMPVRKSEHVDVSKTLFSSVVMLLDEAVTNKMEACQRAEELGAVNILENYLWKVNTEQKAIVISSIVHLMENTSRKLSKKLTQEMYDMVFKADFSIGISVTTPVLNFLKNNLPENSCKAAGSKTRVKGTPHPRKFFKTATNKSPRKLSQSPSILVNRQAPEPNLTAVKELRTSSSSHSIKKLKKYFVSTAEIIVLMNCVRIHGINMQVVRKVWPFHKELTPGDMYGLWKAIWDKKM